MKKLFLSAFMLMGLAFSANAQDLSKNALGLRLGDNDGFGGEISYQRELTKKTRLEFDLGLRNSNHVNAFKLAGVHQWVWNIDGGFNWYAGVGAGIGSWKVDSKYGDSSGTYFFGAGDIGIEYNFDIPLQISLDYRPEFYANNDYLSGVGNDIALGIRYKFN